MTILLTVVVNGPHAALAWKALALPPGVTLSGFEYEPEFQASSALSGRRGAAPEIGDLALICIAVLRNTAADNRRASWVWGVPIRLARITDRLPITGISVRLGPTINVFDPRSDVVSHRLGTALGGQHSLNDRVDVLSKRHLHRSHPYLSGEADFSDLTDDAPDLWTLDSGARDAATWRLVVREVQTKMAELESGWNSRSEAPVVPPASAIRIAAVHRPRRGPKRSWRAAKVARRGREERVSLSRRAVHRVDVLTRWGSAQRRVNGELTYAIAKVGPVADAPRGRYLATPGGVAREFYVTPSDRGGVGQVIFELELKSGAVTETTHLPLDIQVGGLPRPSILIGLAAVTGGMLAQLLAAVSNRLPGNKWLEWMSGAGSPGVNDAVFVGIVLTTVGLASLTFGFARSAEEH